MKLIIDIPEAPLYRDMYTAICENGYIFDEDNEYIAKAIKNGTPIPDNATVCVEPTFDWLQNRVALAKAEINNAIESTFCTKDEAIGLGIALDVIDKYFTI